MSAKIEEPRPSSATLEIVVEARECGWSVEVQDDEGARRVPLSEKRIVVGTAAAADIVVRDPTVSGRHCALSVLGNGVAIEDLGSKNGTFLGSARVREAWGGAGTAVTIGRSSLVFVPERVDAAEGLDEPGLPLPGVAGGSLAMRKLADQVRRLARHGAPVLIAGESGTGKELIARALHSEGPRSGHPFVAMNVTALPRDLVESELFGHERGAFTGAVARRAGAFAEAEGGTLFLDEIGDLPLDAQPKLLRALDGYEVRRVGSAGAGKRTNVRVVAATHVSLEERVTAGLFRRDLFHRIEVFVVQVPPLRARRGDIPPIAKEVLSRLAPEVGRRHLTPAALARLAAYEWPGNVRELRNVLYRACDRTMGRDCIEVDDIVATMPRVESRSPTRLSPSMARALLRDHAGNLSAAARAAGMPRTTFRKLTRA
jgi:DNA-binding NtrC family response regulator